MEKPKPSQKKSLTVVKEKKPFVMTEARKKAFANARAIRMEMADQRKIVKEKEKDEHNKIKKILKDKKELKLKKKQELEIKVLETSSEEEDESPPPPPKKKEVRQRRHHPQNQTQKQNQKRNNQNRNKNQRVKRMLL